MATELTDKLRKRLHLEWEMYLLESRLGEIEAHLPELKYNHRQAKVAATEYEGFGLTSLLHKITGKWEENREELRRKERQAEANLASGERELELLRQSHGALLAELTPLRELGDVLVCAEQLPPGEKEEILTREAGLCLKMLLPTLERTRTSLEEAAQWARPNNNLEAVPGYTKGKLLAQADAEADKCKALLLRLEGCALVLQIHPYFRDPVNYICAVTQFTQLDRIQQAIGAVYQLEAVTRELLSTLPEE